MPGTETQGLYERDAALGRRINERFFGMILALVDRHRQTGRVYVTRDVALPAFAVDKELPPLLAQRYALVPQGIVFELSSDRTFREPHRAALRMRGLFDGTVPIEGDDVVSLKVRPVYLTMVTSRGLYMAAHGRLEQAREAFREALALDPGFEPARQGLARVEALGAR